MSEMICKCGLPMSKNPHAHAGDPRAVSEVGSVYECIPCRVGKARNSYMRICKLEEENFAQSDLIAKLEAEIAKYKIALADSVRRPMGVLPDSAFGLIDENDLREAEGQRTNKYFGNDKNYSDGLR